MMRFLITAIILFFGASATFAQSQEPKAQHYCLHEKTSVYMKVKIFGNYNNEKLVASATILQRGKEPFPYGTIAAFAGRKGKYTYFQTDLEQQGGIFQSTYAVPNDGSHVIVSNTKMDAERNPRGGEIENHLYLCQQKPFY